MQAYDDARKRLSDNVKKARKKVGLSQEALALQAGINRSSLRKGPRWNQRHDSGKEESLHDATCTYSA